jgi:hypothetical protein
MSKQSEKFEPGLDEAKKLIEYLFRSYNLSSYNLSARQLEIVKMKWKYGFTDKQIAEKLSLTENRVKTIYKTILLRIFTRMMRLYTTNPDNEDLKKEIKRLKSENDKYKRKFAELTSEDKKEFKRLDIVMESIHDVGLSKKTTRALYWTNIKTVSDLLQYRLASLLLMKGINTQMVEEIERFTRMHHLRMLK